jgi:hypothetical protein
MINSQKIGKRTKAVWFLWFEFGDFEQLPFFKTKKKSYLPIQEENY